MKRLSGKSKGCLAGKEYFKILLEVSFAYPLSRRKLEYLSVVAVMGGWVGWEASEEREIVGNTFALALTNSYSLSVIPKHRENALSGFSYVFLSIFFSCSWQGVVSNPFNCRLSSDPQVPPSPWKRQLLDSASCSEGKSFSFLHLRQSPCLSLFSSPQCCILLLENTRLLYLLELAATHAHELSLILKYDCGRAGKRVGRMLLVPMLVVGVEAGLLETFLWPRSGSSGARHVTFTKLCILMAQTQRGNSGDGCCQSSSPCSSRIPSCCFPTGLAPIVSCLLGATLQPFSSSPAPC